MHWEWSFFRKMVTILETRIYLWSEDFNVFNDKSQREQYFMDMRRG